jgi:transcription elongation factor GreB
MPDYITPAGYKRLREEYDWLLKTERPRITAEVAYAASLGDRSENAEYIFGKKRLREIDSRLRFLQKRLEAVEVVDPTLLSGTRVRFGAIVDVEDEDCTRTFVIVGEDEVDVKAGRISYKSPLGHALLGREEGDDVAFQAPGGRRTLSISNVRFPRP